MSKLPMDLSKFRKVKSDKHTSTFQHYAGHTITIAHNKLSSKMREQLHKLPTHTPKVQRMAEGGTAGDDNTIDYDKLMSKEAAENAPYGTNPQSNAAQDGVTVASTDPNAGVEEMQPQYDGSLQGPATMPAAPASNDPYGSLAALQQQMGGVQKVGAGQQAEAQAVGAQGKANISWEQEHQNQAKQNLSNYEASKAELTKERQAVMTDIANGHINPKQYLEKMSTGSKIATGIGLILGGMGAGLTHGPNLAFKMLQDNIDRDIEAQKAELGKKNSLLAHNMQQGRDLDEAYRVTQMQSNDILASHLRMTADQTADPLAKARLMEIAGMTDQKTAEIQHQIALSKMQQAALGGGGGGINPVMAIKLLAPPGQQEALMKDLKAKQDSEGNIKNMMDAFDYVAQHNTILGKLNPQNQSRIDAMWDPKMVKLAHDSAGRFNMEELPIMNKYKPKATDDQETIAQKKLGFLNDMKSRMSFPSLEPYGVRSGDHQQVASGNFGFKPRGK